MSERNDGGPAFPASSWSKDGDYLGDNQGMTLRDYFAAKAMQGMLARSGNFECSSIAWIAYNIADAMLAERAK